jgi:hypothetical protein
MAGAMHTMRRPSGASKSAADEFSEEPAARRLSVALGALALLCQLPAARSTFEAAPAAERTPWQRATGFPAAPTASAATVYGTGSGSGSASGSGFVYYNRSVHARATASFDGRSIRIDNYSTLLLGGSVHYMRLTPGMWQDVFAEAKAGGLNAIETYCFWTDHQPVRGGGFDFSTGRLNLTGFVRAAGEAGLWVLLRPGPYVGAEYSGGGFPHWLRDVPGLKYRNYNQPWLDESTRWMAALNRTLRNDLVGNGGNIILSQIENEWTPGSNCMQHTGPSSWTDQDHAGVKFYLWNWQLVQSLNWGIPWMWNSGVPPASLLNGSSTGLIAGLDGDHVHGTPGGLWIEDEGWSVNWGETPKHQTSSNMANRVLQFFAGGGAVHSYYMFFGGNQYGNQSKQRSTSSGCSGQITCYELDVMLNCYGARNEPKFSHLSSLHHSIAAVAPQLLAQAKPVSVPLETTAPATQPEQGGGRTEPKCNAAGILAWAQHPGACIGLKHDANATDAHACAMACCEDLACEIWQREPTEGCWRGIPTGCQTAPLKKASGVRPGAKLPPDKPSPSKSGLVASVFNSTGSEVVILSNTMDTGTPNSAKTAAASATVTWRGVSYFICAGSSLLLSDGKLLFNSSIADDGPEMLGNHATAVQPAPPPPPQQQQQPREVLTWKTWREPIATRRGFDASAGDRNATTPDDQVHVTDDLTDYMWYSTELSLGSFNHGQQLQLELTTGIGTAFLVYLDGHLLGHDDDHTHVGGHGATRMDARGNMSFSFNVPGASSTSAAGGTGKHKLDLLSVSMGINNWLGVEDNWKGLLAGSTARGKLQLVVNATGAATDLTSNGWLMQPWLEGQRRSLQSGGVPPEPWAAVTPVVGGGSGQVAEQHETLRWFRTTFETPAGTAPLVLDAAGLGRGHAYVNSFDIGRFYNITGTPCEQCTCGGDSCCMKQLCGKPSQRLYHIPPDVLKPVGSGETNLLVVFDELGATDLSTVAVRRFTAADMSAGR